MPSISSCLLTITTSYRNPNSTEFNWAKLSPNELEPAKKWKVVLAEAGYLLIIPVSLFESAISLIASFASKCISQDSERKRCIEVWSSSSLFSVRWASVNVIVNPFTNDMLTSERIARGYMSRGYILRYPREMVFEKF